MSTKFVRLCPLITTAGRGSRWQWLLIVSLALSPLPLDAQQADDAKRGDRSVLIRVEGMLTPMVEQYVYRKLERAQSYGADIVILEIDSPGGFRDPSVNIASRLRDLNWALTVAYVPEQALSGAAIAALGADEIVMRPSARLGDAGPIYRDEAGLFRHASEKIRTDLARTVRDLAEDQGRPPALAEAMVDMNLIVYSVKHRQTGEETFMSDAELESAEDADDWEKLKPVLESRQGHFLEVSGRRAVELRLAEATVADRQALLAHYQLDESPLVLEATFTDTLVLLLNAPLVTGLLLLVGLVALYIEFSAPGISIGGLLAGLCFALFFWSRFLGGTSGWLEVVLFGCGAIFIALELFVIPGFGVAGVSGLLLMLVSVVMASQDFVIPSTGSELTIFSRSLVIVLGAGGAFVVAAAVVSHFYGALPVLNWMVLQPPEARQELGDDLEHKGQAAAHGSSSEVHVGDWGLADTPLRPAGKVWFDDGYVDVVTDGAYVERGSRVRVIKVSGNRVVVQQVEPQPEPRADETDRTA